MNATNGDADFFRLNPFLDGLRKELSTLPTEHQAAFALYCSERLYRFYVALAKRNSSSGANALRTLLDELWRHLDAGGMTQGQNKRFLDQLQGIDLGEDACCDEWDGAVDAVGAVSLTLEAWRNGSASSAARAAGNVLNRVHQRLMDEAVGSTYVLSADETLALTRRIEQHPAMKSAQERLLEVVRVLKQRQSLMQADTQHLRSLAQADA